MKLTCPSQDRISEYLEGSMNDTESEKILDHIEDCSNCNHVLTTMEGEQNDLVNEVCEFVRTERLLQEPEFEQLRNAAQFSQGDKITSADVEEPLETGKRLRDYRLVKKIGEGGMGTVYQAVHIHLAKHVALKILPSDKLRSKQSVSRFRQEMRAVGKVNHPNVVSASDAGTIDGHHFLVMELVQGADLARIIHDRGPLSVADACEIVRQAAIGLQHAHDNGLVHRDVKPSNIMLALDGSVKLLDLGLAGLNNTEFESTANVVVTDRLTSVGQIMGTLDYMAPEQITASPEVDGKADIYALGATLFQLLTGRTPCGDRSEGTPDRIEAVLHKPPLDIATLRNDVPDELRALLLKMLAKNPEDRPQAAIDVAGELVRFTSDADLGALAEACRTSLDMPSADVDVTDDVSFVVSWTESKDDVPPRRPYAEVALGGLFLAMLAAAVYFIVTNNGIVKVEVMDESFKVVIDEETVTVSDGESQPIMLRSGDHKLSVWLGETELITEKFQIRRNGKIVFDVERSEGQVVVAKNGERFGAKPMPDKMQPIDVDFSPDVTKMLARSGQSEAEFRKKLHLAISQAAGIPNAQWEKFAADPTGPPAIEGLPLSYLLLVRPTGPAPETSKKSEGFRMLETRDLIFDAMSTSKKIGYASLIQPDYIKQTVLDIDAESQLLRGTAEYEAPKLYAGKVNFAAQYDNRMVKVVEFTLPEYRLAIARDGKGVWRAHKASAKPSAETNATRAAAEQTVAMQPDGAPTRDDAHQRTVHSAKAAKQMATQSEEVDREANLAEWKRLRENWKRLMKNPGEITSLSAEQAAELVTSVKGGRLFLGGLRSIDKGVAQELAKFEGYELNLSGLTAIEPGVARELVNYARLIGRGRLDLNGLVSIDIAVARELAKFRGDLQLDGLTVTDKEIAHELLKCSGLSLDCLTSIDVGVARELAKINSEQLNITGLTSIDQEIARELAEFRGRMGMRLSSVKSIDKETARELAKYGGWYELDGVTSIDKEIAHELGKSKCWRIYLGGLTSIDKETAQELAKFSGDGGLMFGRLIVDKDVTHELAKLKGDLSLRIPNRKDIAEEIANFEGRTLTLGHLAPLDHEVLKILKSIPGVRILGAPPEAGGAK